MPLRKNLNVKRAYEAPTPADGTRVLVDRLWPRGLSRTAAAIDLWLKDIAPSAELRRWFAHDRRKWAEFCRRYAAELDQKSRAVAALRGAIRHGKVTLLFAAKDRERNNAVALLKYLTAKS
jgi:uncharacterized protein YeaO (DUF488 family)